VRALRDEGLISARPSRGLAGKPARLAAIIGAAVLTAAVGLTLVAREADAAKGELLFGDPTPLSGGTVTVEYRPGPALGQRARLVLRAEFHAVGGDRQEGSVWVTVVSTLERASARRFTGSFTLPDSAVYAVFVVEDEEARRIDTNGRAGWDLTVHGPDGRPLLDALVEKGEDLVDRNWELALTTARLATELYPEDPQAVAVLNSLEAHLFGAVTGDSLANAHWARWSRLEAAYSGEPDPEPAVRGWLWVLARTVGDSASEARRREHMMNLSSRHWLVAQARLMRVMAEQYAQPEALLLSLEGLWDEFGPVYYQVPLQGLLASERVGRVEDLRGWANRYLLLRPGEVDWVAARLAASSLDSARQIGIEMLEVQVQELAGGGTGRPLFLTPAEKELEDARVRSGFRGQLGSALLAAGRAVDAIAELEQAVEIGWPLAVFRSLGEAKLITYDSAGALEAWANVAADPATAIAFEDSVESRLGGGFDIGRWRRLTQRGKTRMKAAILEGATRLEVKGRVALLDSAGRSTAFDDLRRGQVTVVAFWSRFCGPSIEQLPELMKLTRSLEDNGVRVLAITDEPPSQEVEEFVQRYAPGLRVFHDVRSDLTRALNQWATPEYYVLDRDGDVRFVLSRLSDLERQTAVLMVPDGD